MESATKSSNGIVSALQVVVKRSACDGGNLFIARGTRTILVRQDSGFWRVYILISQREIEDTVREIGTRI